MRDAAKAPTILDVAAAAGVSKSLVSMVLRGDPGVTSARRERVLAAIEMIGYRRNRAAAILAGNRTNTIGVVLDDYRNLWYVPLLSGVQEALAPYGYRVTVADTALNAHIDANPFDDFVSLRVDGVLIATEPDPAMVVPSGLPVVVAGERATTVAGADVVTNDELVGGGLATTHLLSLGHTRIGHLTGSGGAATVRATAYRSAMTAAGLEPVVIGGGGTSEADGYAGARRIFLEHPDITGIFAANDTMAMGVLGAARELGIRVPEDLSLIGYDDSPIAASPLLTLSTIDARSADVGRVAAELLVRRLGDAREEPSGGPVAPADAPAAAPEGSTAAPVGSSAAPAPASRHLLEPRLILRSSTAQR